MAPSTMYVTYYLLIFLSTVVLLLTGVSKYFRCNVCRRATHHVDRFHDLHRQTEVCQLQRHVAVLVLLNLTHR